MLWLQKHRADLLPADLEADRGIDELDFSMFGKKAWAKPSAPISSLTAMTVPPSLDAGEPEIYFDTPFERDGIFVKIDVLAIQDGRTEMIKFKSSTRVKPHFIADCAIQAWVASGDGRQFDSIKLAIADSKAQYDGDPRSVLALQDVTEQVQSIVDLVPQWIEESRRILAGEMPDIPSALTCGSPFECPFRGFCHPACTTKYPLSILGRSKDVAELGKQGVLDVRDVPEGSLKSKVAERLRRITASGKAELDPKAADFLGSLGFPRFYLDFESAQTAAPMWEGVRPYQQVPFQWSCHIEESSGSIAHWEFLDLTGENPQRNFAEALIETVGTRGPIFGYSTFERDRLKEIAEQHVDLAPAIERILVRIVDLLPVVRSSYYHPDMKGLYSIKVVLPIIAPHLGYEDLGDVADGIAAQRAYIEAVAADTTEERKFALREKLLRYCERDTVGLVALAHFLEGRFDPHARLFMK